MPGAKLKLLRLDLSNLKQVKEAAQEVLSWNTPIDVLINNAAVVSHQPVILVLTRQMDTPYTVTSEGHELQFVTNYLGPWLFTQSLLPLDLKSTGKRVVMVASSGHANGSIRWDDPAFKEGYHRKQA